MVCTAKDDCHDVGECNDDTGKCSEPILSGTNCDDGMLSTYGDVCNSGVCTGTGIHIKNTKYFHRRARGKKQMVYLVMVACCLWGIGVVFFFIFFIKITVTMWRCQCVWGATPPADWRQLSP